MRKKGNITVRALHEASLSIEIKVMNPNRFGVSLSGFIGCVFFLFPFAFLLTNEVEIGFGYVITIFLCWSCSFYFIRKALWSWIGKEVYNIKKDSIDYHYDYYLFKDRITEKKFNILQFGYKKLDEDSVYLWQDSMKIETDFDCHLVLMLDDEPLISNITVFFKDVLEAKDKLHILF